jgi:flavorubredoxin
MTQGIASNGGRSYPVELFADKLYAVGANVPLEGKASWAPVDATGYQPANCYLLLAEEPENELLIIDPGMAYVEEAVVSGLKTLLPENATPRVFITRAQFDCVGNLGAIAGVFPVQNLYTGGYENPFDSFETVTSVDKRTSSMVLFRAPSESRLEVINTTLRMLATFWGYDAGTKALFTSDSFTHAVVKNAHAAPVLNSHDADDTTPERVRAHLHATFWWLKYAELQPIIDDLRALFDRLDVEIIAPGRGRILRGRDVVDRHVELLIDALEEIGLAA